MLAEEVAAAILEEAATMAITAMGIIGTTGITVTMGTHTMTIRTHTKMRILILAILASALCSCAGFKGFHLKRGDDYDNMGHGYVSGSGDPGK